MPAKLNIAVFASGKGSNFRAILDAIRSGRIRNAQIVLVISNNADAGALATAVEFGIPALHVSRKQFVSEDAFCEKILGELDNHHISLIVLAGYMKKVEPIIIRRYKNRMINIHPALLPAFGGKGMYGIRVHEAVIAAGSTISGATVHLVDDEYDHGTVLLQKTAPVFPNDTPEILAERILRVEHELYPETIRLIAEGTLSLDNYQAAPRT